MQRPLAPVSLVFACLALACQPPAIPGDDAGSETSDSAGTDSATASGDGDGDTGPGTDTDPGTDTNPGTDTDTAPDPGACASALDILFVVDNSGSMGEVQRRLALSLSALIDPLEQQGVDWRVGVTTSDNGNPWCPAGQTTPEGGQLVASSCRARLGDFVFNNDVDVQAHACTEFCELQQLDFLPTTTSVDNVPAERPWIESIDGQLNLSEGTATQALSCMLPMGINGCGFESQLESSYLSLIRAQSNNELNYGFLRPEASLLVIIVSDEVDCSYNKDWAEIFEPDGNKVFWSDPDSAFPTSAVCWNAGVSCLGDPSGYDACLAVNKGANGNEDVPDGDAVLHPLTRYQGLIAGLELEKRSVTATATVRVTLIGGAGANGDLAYADVGAIDPQQQNSFGIGPGCTDGELVSALPPVRMRNVALESGGTIGSACKPEYSDELGAALEPFFAECD